MKTELELTVHFEVGEYGGIFAWLESVEHRDLQILPYLSESDKAHLVDAHLANQARGSTGPELSARNCVGIICTTSPKKYSRKK